MLQKSKTQPNIGKEEHTNAHKLQLSELGTGSYTLTHQHTHTAVILPLVLVAMSATFWKASRKATAARTVVLDEQKHSVF